MNSAITTASKKAKGRRLQQLVAESIIKKYSKLTEDDVKSTGMGQSGVDVQLSSAAQKLFPYAVECKNRAAMAVYKDWNQCKNNAGTRLFPLLVIKQDRAKPLAVIDFEHFMELIT